MDNNRTVEGGVGKGGRPVYGVRGTGCGVRWVSLCSHTPSLSLSPPQVSITITQGGQDKADASPFSFPFGLLADRPPLFLPHSSSRPPSPVTLRHPVARDDAPSPALAPKRSRRGEGGGGRCALQSTISASRSLSSSSGLLLTPVALGTPACRKEVKQQHLSAPSRTPVMGGRPPPHPCRLQDGGGAKKPWRCCSRERAAEVRRPGAS